MSNTYLLTYPNGSQVTAKGVSISTQTVQVQIPPTVPALFRFYVSAPNLPFQQTGGINYELAGFWSWQVPTFFMYPRFRNDPYCGLRITTTNQFGQTNNYDGQAGMAYFCGSLYMTPGVVTVSRCDALITDSSGNILTIQGIDGAGCPTWTTTPSGDCLPTEIKCDDPSDPRGFCCVSCDSLNSKIRALI